MREEIRPFRHRQLQPAMTVPRVATSAAMRATT